MELSYFPEVLVGEADSSVGGERFVFRAANSPKGSQGPVHRFALRYRQGNGGTEAQLRSGVYGELQPARAGGAGTSSWSRLRAVLPAHGGMDGQMDRHSIVQLECRKC